MLFSTFRIDESSVNSASGNGFFKYGETTSKWDLVGLIVHLLVLAHLETFVGLDLCFFQLGKRWVTEN